MSVELNGFKWTTWDDVRKEVFTPEEIAESDLRVALIGELTKARKERGISQRELEELSGVKQPVIARMENGSTPAGRRRSSSSRHRHPCGTWSRRTGWR